ncbi:MAG: AraC family transcriptional regulator [Ignavibacteriae bacterium]|nr:AraC family transcriptional regulator [Ignavibacteriota bacterium]
MSATHTTPNPALEQAIVHIKERWREGKTLKEIAHLYRVDQSNLARAFRKTQQCTFKQYTDLRRTEHVQVRLVRNNVLGYQLAAELGFPTDHSFYRWVKRTLGVSFTRLQERIHRETDAPKRDVKPVTIKRDNKG